MRRKTVTTVSVMALWFALPGPLSPVQAAVVCDGRVVTIQGVAGMPTIGTPGDDVIVGSEQADVIDGAAGNDTICGLEGGDTIRGGPGDDRLFGGLDEAYEVDDGYFGDLVVPGPGDDHVDLGDDPSSEDIWIAESPVWYDRVSFRDAARRVDVNLFKGAAAGEGTDTIAVPQFSAGIIGSAHDDTLIGSSTRDLIQAGGGDDRVMGRDGDDRLEPDVVGPTVVRTFEVQNLAPGDDVVRGGDGQDFVKSEIGTDRIHGDGERDVLRSAVRGSSAWGGAGKDLLVGRPGVHLYGGRGSDNLTSALRPQGSYQIDGGPGPDELRLRAPRKKFAGRLDWLIDVPGQRILVDGRRLLSYRDVTNLVVLGTRGHAKFIGGPERDSFWATGLRIHAYGGGGRDSLTGGLLDDLLDGGPGHDTLSGSAGRDRCLHGELLDSCEVRR